MHLISSIIILILFSILQTNLLNHHPSSPMASGSRSGKRKAEESMSSGESRVTQAQYRAFIAKVKANMRATEKHNEARLDFQRIVAKLEMMDEMQALINNSFALEKSRLEAEQQEAWAKLDAIEVPNINWNDIGDDGP